MRVKGLSIASVVDLLSPNVKPRHPLVYTLCTIDDFTACPGPQKHSSAPN
jgi:hypothetical protein